MIEERDEFCEQIIAGATQHGEDSEPDHEVGDLQDALRTVFLLLTEDQVQTLAAMPEIRTIINGGVDPADGG